MRLKRQTAGSGLVVRAALAGAVALWLIVLSYAALSRYYPSSSAAACAESPVYIHHHHHHDATPSIPAHLLPSSPILSIAHHLSHCPSSGSSSSPDFTRRILLPRVKGESTPRLTVAQFVCEANCSVIEPELESAFRHLGSPLSHIRIHALVSLCDKGRVPALIYITGDGQAKWTLCGDRKRIRASHQFFLVLRAVLVLSRMVSLDNRPVVFAFDTSDYSRPTAEDPHGLHWMYTEPAIVRFVGDTTHPALLWPTTPYWKQTAYCDMDKDGDEWLTSSGPCRKQQPDSAWHELKNEVFWRGSPTGFPIDDLHVDFMPRSLLNRAFAGKPGYDVGFAEDAVPPYANARFMKAHTWLPRVSRNTFREYKMILSLDGHTASWGLIERLGTGSVLLMVQSLREYREFYYALLEPWKHYAPVAFDYSNLDRIREWVLTQDGEGERLAVQAKEVVQRRMRAEDTWCYLVRLLDNLAHKEEMTTEHEQDWSELDQFKWISITRESVSRYEAAFKS